MSCINVRVNVVYLLTDFTGSGDSHPKPCYCTDCTANRLVMEVEKNLRLVFAAFKADYLSKPMEIC